MTAIMAPPVDALARPRPRAPNLLAEQITGRQYLSHTQITLMRTCPRKFSFQYVEKAPKDFIPTSLLVGAAIHSCFELYFRSMLEVLGVTHEVLLSAYDDAWKRIRGETGNDIPVRYNKGESEESLHALADRMLTSFLSSPLASPKGTIVGVEEELRITLDEDLPDVLAKVDLVTQTDGALHVIDFKTSRSRWTDDKAQESADQLILYGVTTERMSRSLGLPVKLHFAIVTKAKTPVVQLLSVASNPERVTLLKESIGQVWQAIQVGNFYPSPSPQNCTTCQFRSRCPVFAVK